MQTHAVLPYDGRLKYFASAAVGNGVEWEVDST
jgi:hypothetical protein